MERSLVVLLAGVIWLSFFFVPMLWNFRSYSRDERITLTGTALWSFSFMVFVATDVYRLLTSALHIGLCVTFLVGLTLFLIGTRHMNGPESQHTSST